MKISEYLEAGKR